MLRLAAAKEGTLVLGGLVPQDPCLTQHAKCRCWCWTKPTACWTWASQST